MDIVIKVVLVADSTKFGYQSLAHVCGLDEIDRIVVDAELAPQWQETINSAKPSLHLAEPLTK